MNNHFYAFVQQPVLACFWILRISVTSTVIMSARAGFYICRVLFSSSLYCDTLIAKHNLKMAALDLRMQPAAWTQSTAFIALPASSPMLCEWGCVKSLLQHRALWLTLILCTMLKEKQGCERFKHVTLPSLVNIYTPLQSFGISHENICGWIHIASSGGFCLETLISPMWYCATIRLRLGIDLSQHDEERGGLGL